MMELSFEQQRFWEKAVLILLLCTVISVTGYFAVNVKDPREKKCIDGELYWLTDQGYWLTTNYNSKRCKVLPVEVRYDSD